MTSRMHGSRVACFIPLPNPLSGAVQKDEAVLRKVEGVVLEMDKQVIPPSPPSSVPAPIWAFDSIAEVCCGMRMVLLQVKGEQASDDVSVHSGNQSSSFSLASSFRPSETPTSTSIINGVNAFMYMSVCVSVCVCARACLQPCVCMYVCTCLFVSPSASFSAFACFCKK